MYIPRLYAESRSLKRTRQPRLTEPGERMKRVFLDQPADNKRGQDGLIPQLYARAPTQTTFVPITGYFPVKSPNKRQPLSLCLFFFFSFFFQTEQSETHLLYLFFLVSYLLLLICHFVYSRKKDEGGAGGHKGGIKVKSSILIRATAKKKKK